MSDNAVSRASSDLGGSPPPPPPAADHLLQLATLLWDWKGEPKYVTIDDEYDTEPLGTYEAGPSKCVELNLQHSWSEEHAAFVYAIPQPHTMTFEYTRRTFVSDIPSGWAEQGIAAGMLGGDAHTIGPLLRLHRASEHAFPETLEEVDKGNPNCFRGPGPPFDFIPHNWLCGNPEPRDIGYHAINVSDPDLPGQGDRDLIVQPILDDEGGTEYLGWGGPWLSDLLEKREKGEDLGTRREIKWSDFWGVELEFKPVAFTTSDWRPHSHSSDEDSDTSVSDDGEDRAPIYEHYISGYSVKATVLRIFVKPEWFALPQHPEALA